MFFQLRYGIKYFNSGELSLILSFIRFLLSRENKFFNFLLLITFDVPPMYLFPFKKCEVCIQLINMAQTFSYLIFMQSPETKI